MQGAVLITGQHLFSSALSLPPLTPSARYCIITQMITTVRFQDLERYTNDDIDYE